jgi:hypothetical protein
MGPNHKSKGHKERPTGPTPWPTGQTLSRFRPRHDGYAPKSVSKIIPCLKVGGDREERPAGHIDGCPVGHMDGYPTIHQLQTDSIKSAEAPLDIYIRILTIKFRTYHTILIVLHLLMF